MRKGIVFKSDMTLAILQTYAMVLDKKRHDDFEEQAIDGKSNFCRQEMIYRLLGNSYCLWQTVLLVITNDEERG